MSSECLRRHLLAVTGVCRQYGGFHQDVVLFRWARGYPAKQLLYVVHKSARLQGRRCHCMFTLVVVFETTVFTNNSVVLSMLTPMLIAMRLSSSGLSVFTNFTKRFCRLLKMSGNYSAWWCFFSCFWSVETVQQTVQHNMWRTSWIQMEERVSPLFTSSDSSAPFSTLFKWNDPY